MSDPRIYAATLISIAASLVVLGVAVRAIRVALKRRTKHEATPAMFALLVAMCGMAVSQIGEQTRVLVFRLSYDGLMSSDAFTSVYFATWNVASTKVLFAMSSAAGATTLLTVMCGRDNRTVLRWTLFAALAAYLLWESTAALLDYFTL